MFRVTANGGGKLTRHYIKPLEIIWRLIPQFTPANTIHVISAVCLFCCMLLCCGHSVRVIANDLT